MILTLLTVLFAVGFLAWGLLRAPRGHQDQDGFHLDDPVMHKTDGSSVPRALPIAILRPVIQTAQPVASNAADSDAAQASTITSYR